MSPTDEPVRWPRHLEELRCLLSWDRAERNWWNVRYYYIVDHEGRIYEGRDSRHMGETNIDYDPLGHVLVSVLDNYNEQEPTRARIDALTQLMAWATDIH